VKTLSLKGQKIKDWGKIREQASEKTEKRTSEQLRGAYTVRGVSGVKKKGKGEKSQIHMERFSTRREGAKKSCGLVLKLPEGVK